MFGSLVLHALLLGVDFPKDALTRPVELLAPIMARLMEPAPPPPAPPVEEPVAAAAPTPVPKPRAQPETKPAPVPPLASRPEPERIAEPESVPAPIAKAAPAPQPAPAVRPDNTPSLIASYRAALLAEAGRHKRYPPQALDNGWEGEVVVRMAIAADGSIAALNVKSSSGHAALDRQALEMFRKAGGEVRVPDALRGRHFSLELRAVFNLKDQASG